MATGTIALNSSRWKEVSPGATSVLVQLDSTFAAILHLSDTPPADTNSEGIKLSADGLLEVTLNNIPLGQTLYAKAVKKTSSIVFLAS